MPRKKTTRKPVRRSPAADVAETDVNTPGQNSNNVPTEIAVEFGSLANGSLGEVASTAETVNSRSSDRKNVGRPPGSTTQDLESVRASPSVCVRPGCNSTDREVLKKLPDVSGTWNIDGTPRNVMRRRRVQCCACGQNRIETSFHFDTVGADSSASRCSVKPSSLVDGV